MLPLCQKGSRNTWCRRRSFRIFSCSLRAKQLSSVWHWKQFDFSTFLKEFLPSSPSAIFSYTQARFPPELEFRWSIQFLWKRWWVKWSHCISEFLSGTSWHREDYKFLDRKHYPCSDILQERELGWAWYQSLNTADPMALSPLAYLGRYRWLCFLGLGRLQLVTKWICTPKDYHSRSEKEVHRTSFRIPRFCLSFLWPHRWPSLSPSGQFQGQGQAH